MKKICYAGFAAAVLSTSANGHGQLCKFNNVVRCGLQSAAVLSTSIHDHDQPYRAKMLANMVCSQCLSAWYNFHDDHGQPCRMNNVVQYCLQSMAVLGTTSTHDQRYQSCRMNNAVQCGLQSVPVLGTSLHMNTGFDSMNLATSCTSVINSFLWSGPMQRFQPQSSHCLLLMASLAKHMCTVQLRHIPQWSHLSWFALKLGRCLVSSNQHHSEFLYHLSQRRPAISALSLDHAEAYTLVADVPQWTE